MNKKRYGQEFEEEEKRRCPNCKGVRFSVLIYGYRDWDSEADEWGDVQTPEVMYDVFLDIDEATFMCLNCKSSYKSHEELELFD